MIAHILSIDPGKESGIAFLSWTGNQEDLPIKEFSMEVGEAAYSRSIDMVLNGWKAKGEDYLHVVCERFTINAQTVKNSQAPYSLEQIGVLKHLCREAGYPVEKISFQTPADAKAMFPNDTLKKIGTWHKGGEGHANDAIRHALLKMIKVGWKPKILLD